MNKNDPTGLFMAKLEKSLGKIAPADRKAVLDDIRQHLAEAQTEGLSESEALVRLGDPEELGRAYVVELAIDGRDSDPGGWIDTLLRLVGLLAIGSLPTIVIVSVLGSVGAVFFGVGILLFVAASLAVIGVPIDWISWDNLSAPWALLVGPVMAAGGVVLLYLLYRYLRLLAVAVIRTIPRRRKAPVTESSAPSPRHAP